METPQYYTIVHRDETGEKMFTDTAKYVYPESVSLMVVVGGDRDGQTILSFDIMQKNPQ